MANSSDPVCCPFDAPALDWALPPILVLEFSCGLVGNTVVLWTFLFCMDTWKPNSVYLIHLAVADSVVLFCLPVRADYYWRGKNWVHGDVLCRILLFLLACNRLAGIFFLTAAGVDRYLKILHPQNPINQMGLKYAQAVSCGLWALILCMTTYLLSKKHFFYNNGTQCESFNICMGFDPLATWHTVLYVIQFFLPASFITFSTVRIAGQVRSKIDNQGKIKRAVQFVLAMALVFIVCFFPSTVCCVAVLVLKFQYNECSYFRVVNLAFYTSVCSTYFNSVLNPVIYYFSCPAFSRTFQNLFHRLLGRNVSQEESTTNNRQSTTKRNNKSNHRSSCSENNNLGNTDNSNNHSSNGNSNDSAVEMKCQSADG